MPLQLVTAPYAEPLHLTDALSHIKQDSGIDDSHVQATITAARKSAENKTWRQLVAEYNLHGTDLRQWNGPYLAEFRCNTAWVAAVIHRIGGRINGLRCAIHGRVLDGFNLQYRRALNVTANTVSIKLWKTLAVGDVVRFSNSGGALPAPLQLNTDYYVVAVPSSGVYQVSATAGGLAIVLTDAGTGLNFIGEIPGDIMTWIKMRVGSLDQYREEAIAMNRGKIEDLPFVDSLLDGYAPWW